MEGNGQDPTPVLLQKLIDAVNGVRDEVAKTNARLDQTNARLDQTREDLGARIDGVRVDLDGVRVDLGARIDGVRLEVVAVRALARAEERADRELRDRVERIEQHLGLQPAP